MRPNRTMMHGSCLVLVVSCGQSETEVPQVPQTPRVSPVPAGAHPVAYAPLANHLPRIVSHAEASELTRMTLWAIGTDGLRERVFDADTGPRNSTR